MPQEPPVPPSGPEDRSKRWRDYYQAFLSVLAGVHGSIDEADKRMRRIVDILQPLEEYGQTAALHPLRSLVLAALQVVLWHPRYLVRRSASAGAPVEMQVLVEFVDPMLLASLESFLSVANKIRTPVLLVMFIEDMMSAWTRAGRGTAAALQATAEILNATGFTTLRGYQWTDARVKDFYYRSRRSRADGGVGIRFATEP